MNYSVLGVSSGIGVSLYPFRKYLVGNIEARAIFHTPENIQWINNFGLIPLFRVLNDKTIKKTKPVDVIISSPDCGSGSVLRYSRAKKLGDHKKNASLNMFFDSIVYYQPKFILFENLDGLWKSFPKDDFFYILDNYRFMIHQAPVTMWGNSQLHRKRLVIVAIRKDLPDNIDKYFKLPDYRIQNKTCWELYGDLDDTPISERVCIAHVRESPDEQTTIYAGRKLFNWEITQIWQNELKNLRRWTDTPGKKFSSAPGVYRNRRKDYPATARKANRQFDHKGRMMTPRQLARIQGVPDSFKLHIDLDRLNYWINKGRAAVTKSPPFEISVWFKEKLEKTYDYWHYL
jgi:site-specific DNA-cytosine methylase